MEPHNTRFSWHGRQFYQTKLSEFIPIPGNWQTESMPITKVKRWNFRPFVDRNHAALELVVAESWAGDGKAPDPRRAGIFSEATLLAQIDKMAKLLTV
jgi:hypothetical protein